MPDQALNALGPFPILQAAAAVLVVFAFVVAMIWGLRRAGPGMSGAVAGTTPGTAAAMDIGAALAEQLATERMIAAIDRNTAAIDRNTAVHDRQRR
jgi:hypothetical protein